MGSSFEATWSLYLLNRLYYPDSYRRRLRLKAPALLKLNLENRFPRLYPTRRLVADGSLYYGPFPSRVAAERLASEFLDFFKVRRCVEDLKPDPAHPGCIYSQMQMCLAPCFAGCTDEQYQAEVERVVAFLDGSGQPLIREFEQERAQASERLEFEQAGKIHSKIERVQHVVRQKPEIVRPLKNLHAVILLPGAAPQSVAFFRVRAGELRGPVYLTLGVDTSSPRSLDRQIEDLLAPLAQPAAERLPLWEHLALLARWYYSSFRQGELVILEPDRPLPARALIRACRRVLAAESPPS